MINQSVNWEVMDFHRTGMKVALAKNPEFFGSRAYNTTFIPETERMMTGYGITIGKERLPVSFKNEFL
jgi:hypothetical protein